jgi:hypothetical protein
VSHCQVARSWVDVGSFDTRLVVRFMIFIASVRNILDTPTYVDNVSECLFLSRRREPCDLIQNAQDQRRVMIYSSAPVSTDNTFQDLPWVIPNAIYNVDLDIEGGT